MSRPPLYPHEAASDAQPEEVMTGVVIGLVAIGIVWLLVSAVGC